MAIKNLDELVAFKHGSHDQSTHGNRNSRYRPFNVQDYNPGGATIQHKLGEILVKPANKYGEQDVLLNGQRVGRLGMGAGSYTGGKPNWALYAQPATGRTGLRNVTSHRDAAIRVAEEYVRRTKARSSRESLRNKRWAESKEKLLREQPWLRS